MWVLLKSLFAKWALFKILLKTLGSLAWLIPIAFILKAIGLPLLALIGVLGAPIFIVLAIVGLPIILVFVFGGILLAILFGILSMGLVALKIALPIILVVWLVRWMLRATKDKPDAGTPPVADAGDTA
jgi:hypothetical protein